jgi:TnpA family transposase
VLPKPDPGEVDPRLPIVDMTIDSEPPQTGPLRAKLFGLLPLRQLPQVLRQVLGWVDFLAPLREALEDDLRIADWVDRLLFILVGEGCNIGLDNMATATDRYSYNQLAHLAARCLRPEVLKKAIAAVINHHQKMWLTSLWGKGIWSSADGHLFSVSHKTLRSRKHPKASLRMRAINIVTHVLDTLVSYACVLIQTTSHESRVHLDGLLYHEADVHPKKHTSDTAGYTDAMFGMTSMLRIFFAPRIRNPRETRLYFWDKADAALYPNVFAYLDEPARLNEVRSQWDSIVNMVAAAWCGITPPSRSLRKLEALGERNALCRAIQAIGHIEKTIVFLSYAISPTLQSEVIKQNTKTEHSNQLQDRLFFGNRGIIRLNDPLDIYTRMLCLQLLVNVVILYNTAWLQAAIKAYRGIGTEILDDLLAHVWPTVTSHINLLGYFIVDDSPDLRVGIEELVVSLQTD